MLSSGLSEGQKKEKAAVRKLGLRNVKAARKEVYAKERRVTLEKDISESA